MVVTATFGAFAGVATGIALTSIWRDFLPLPIVCALACLAGIVVLAIRTWQDSEPNTIGPIITAVICFFSGIALEPCARLSITWAGISPSPLVITGLSILCVLFFDLIGSELMFLFRPRLVNRGILRPIIKLKNWVRATICLSMAATTLWPIYCLFVYSMNNETWGAWAKDLAASSSLIATLSILVSMYITIRRTITAPTGYSHVGEFEVEYEKLLSECESDDRLEEAEDMEGIESNSHSGRGLDHD